MTLVNYWRQHHCTMERVEANTVGTWETGRRQPTFTIPQMIAFAKLLKQVKIDLAEFPYDTLGVLEEDEKNEDMARAS